MNGVALFLQIRVPKHIHQTHTSMQIVMTKIVRSTKIHFTISPFLKLEKIVDTPHHNNGLEKTLSLSPCSSSTPIENLQFYHLIIVNDSSP